MTQLTQHFSLEEFTRSEKAEEQGIDNTMPAELMDNALETAAMLERVRAYLSAQAGRDIPVSLSSGYRCLALNRALGSKDTSDHVKALAGDLGAPAFGTPLQICQALAPVVDKLGIGQLIYEHTWVHCGARLPEKPLNRIITVQGKDYVVGIVP